MKAAVKRTLVVGSLLAGLVGVTACNQVSNASTEDMSSKEYKALTAQIQQLKALNTAQTKMIKEYVQVSDRSFLTNIKDWDDTIMSTQFEVTKVDGNIVTVKDIRGFELTFDGDAKKGDMFIITTLNDDAILDIQPIDSAVGSDLKKAK